MSEFKQKMHAYFPSDGQRLADGWMQRDPSRHGMHQQDLTEPREGVAPMRRFKTGGHVMDDYKEDTCSPTAKIGKRVNEAYQRTAHRHGGSVRGQKGLPDDEYSPASGPTAGHKKTGGEVKRHETGNPMNNLGNAKHGGHMHEGRRKHRDLGGTLHQIADQVSKQEQSGSAPQASSPAPMAQQPMQGAKKGGAIMKHIHHHKHYDAGGVPSDIGLNPNPKTSREKYDQQRGTPPLHRAMGGAGKIRKGVMDAMGKQLTSV
jgi:hypothetical protein